MIKIFSRNKTADLLSKKKYINELQYSSVLDNQNILITGGTGSFGHQMVKELKNYNPKKIVIFSRDEDKQHQMKQEFFENHNEIFQKMKFIIGDVRDYDRLYAATKNIDIIFHAAALKQVPTVELHPFEAVKTNVIGSSNIIKASIARNVKKVIAISTDKAVKPVNAMGMTKALQEKILLAEEFEEDKTIFCCVRYGNVLGSRGSVIPLWDRKIQSNQPLPITHPEMTRYMLTLTQAIQLVFYALKNSNGGEIFVKKSPGSKIVDLAKAYAELITKNQDYPIEFIGIRSGEKIDEVLISQEEMRHTKEEEDYFVIEKELDFDNTFVNKTIHLSEYTSSSTNQLTIEELKILMSELNWVQ
jgi:UDP-N-acetylglucosamine 4,6-dehydratase/5-epimerase